MDQGQRNNYGSSSSKTLTANKDATSDKNDNVRSSIDYNNQSDNVRTSSVNQGNINPLSGVIPKQQPWSFSSSGGSGQSSSGSYNRRIPSTRQRQQGETGDDVTKSIVSFDIY